METYFFLWNESFSHKYGNKRMFLTLTHKRSGDGGKNSY